MQDINSTVEGQTIAFTSIVVGQVPSKTFVVEGDAVCPNCYSTERIHAGLDRKLHAMTCFKSSCRGAKMEIQKSNLKTEDIQTIVYSAGKENGYEKNLRDWFKLIYQVLFSGWL